MLCHCTCFGTADDLEIVGVITHKWKPLIPTVRCEAELVLVANNVQVGTAHFFKSCAGVKCIHEHSLN